MLCRTKEKMSGTTCIIKRDLPKPGEELGRFLRFYVCLQPLKQGFKMRCRPLVGLDGYFLKGPFGGHLLTAVGVYGNSGMWPIARDVVESENTDSWIQFLQLLVEDIEIANSGGRCIISDKQKVLVLSAALISLLHHIALL